MIFGKELELILADQNLNALVHEDIGHVIQGFQNAQLGVDVKSNMSQVKQSLIAIQDKIKNETGRDVFLFDGSSFIEDVQTFLLTITNKKDLM